MEWMAGAGFDVYVGHFICSCGTICSCKANRGVTGATVRGLCWFKQAFADEIRFTASVNQPNTSVFWCGCCNCWQMSFTDFVLGTDQRSTVVTGCTALLIIASEAALAVEELDDFLQLACNDLSTVGNQLVGLWHWLRCRIVVVIHA